jgi:hypothetical protein
MQLNHGMYCSNGHFQGLLVPNSRPVGPAHYLMGDDFSALKKAPKFCHECGMRTMAVCSRCEHPIQIGMTRPSFCGECGAPYPWTETALAAAKEYADELDELTAEDKAVMKKSFDDLTTDTPRTPVAATRFKKIMVKIGPAAGDALSKIVVNFATEAAKKLAGL